MHRFVAVLAGMFEHGHACLSRCRHSFYAVIGDVWACECMFGHAHAQLLGSSSGQPRLTHWQDVGMGKPPCRSWYLCACPERTKKKKKKGLLCLDCSPCPPLVAGSAGSAGSGSLGEGSRTPARTRT